MIVLTDERADDRAGSVRIVWEGLRLDEYMTHPASKKERIQRMKELGFFHARLSMEHRYSSMMVESWCVEHFGDFEFHYLAYDFIFRREEDATLFALRWT